MKRPLVVQKYGGTSVGSIDRIKNVAQRIVRTQETGKDVVVVVSAMGGETDKLVGLAKEITETPNQREMDLLLSSGERISCALLTMAIQSLGCPAIAMTGRQMGLLTDNTHTRARIKQIDAARAHKMLQDKHVVVVAGFQGINEFGDVTTLGRGGSDTSAVALAVALNADACEIYTDVDGVYTTDPRIVPEAHKIDRVSFEEMLEMASLGCKVLQIRSVEFASNYKMPLVVRSSYNDGEGTLICEENETMEQPVVSGVTYDKDQAKITISGVADQPGIAARVFSALARAELSVDVIIQNVSAQGHTDISFTLPRSHVHEGMTLMKPLVEDMEGTGVSFDEDIAKISIVGAGMRSHSGVAARMFECLSRENINIMMITTSEIRISIIIQKKYTELAVQTLHQEFALETGQSRQQSTERKMAGS